MSDDLDILADALRDARGPDNAITQPNLARACGWFRPDGKTPDTRRVQHLLELRRTELPFLVVGGATGMYVVTDPDHLNQEMVSRRNRIRAIAQGWRQLRDEAVRRGHIFENGRFVKKPTREFLFPEMDDPAPVEVEKRNLFETPSSTVSNRYSAAR